MELNEKNHFRNEKKMEDTTSVRGCVMDIATHPLCVFSSQAFVFYDVVVYYIFFREFFLINPFKTKYLGETYIKTHEEVNATHS